MIHTPMPSDSTMNGSVKSTISGFSTALKKLSRITTTASVPAVS